MNQRDKLGAAMIALGAVSTEALIGELGARGVKKRDVRKFEKITIHLHEIYTLLESETSSETVWHFQEKNWPSMNDPKCSLCDVPGGDCTRQVENVNCEACLRLLNQHLQEKFK